MGTDDKYIPSGQTMAALGWKPEEEEPGHNPLAKASVAIDTCVEQFATVKQTVETLEKLIGMQQTPGLSVSPMLLNALFRLAECQFHMCVEWPNEMQKAGGWDEVPALAERFNLLRNNSNITWVDEACV